MELWALFGFDLILLCTLVAAKPEITGFTKVVKIKEGTSVNEELSKITCHDPDGDKTTTSITSMVPNNPCSLCFEVLNNGADESLQYRAGVGTLDHSSAPSYLLTLTCSDMNHESTTEVIEVTVLPNTPPHFDPDKLFDSATMSAGMTSGTVVYHAQADDEEHDDIKYSLQVLPASSAGNYVIDPVTGEIKTTVDLKRECRNDVTFKVGISDGTNTVGPLVIDGSIPDANVPPVAANLDTTVQVPEDATGTAYKMLFSDGNGDPVTYTVTSNNAPGVAQFTLDGKNPNVDIAGALNYEDLASRQTDLTIQATDGFCTSSPYHLRLKVTDVNEPPKITPDRTEFEVCEGQREFDSHLHVLDEDQPDTQRWTLLPMTSNPEGQFGIDPTTGFLKTLMDYDVDVVTTPRRKTFYVQVEDKGGLTSSATVEVTFVDCNDNAPIFDIPDYTFAATECTSAGTKIGTISATDKDSSREQNNVIYYQGSGGGVSVGSGGEVVITQALKAGTVVTFNAYAYDRGQTPGPLRSKNPAVISVRFTPCPTTPPPRSTTKPPPTTTTPTTTTKKYSKKGDDNLPWIIIAALLGTFLMGVLGYMLWRYGHLCLRSCRNATCGRKCCKTRPKSNKYLYVYLMAQALFENSTDKE
ncbi:protein dachsous-like [Physella acuta]|uniref:protein dachsous-like n=1 Tax=Physella acuta TaxID=109671 RepID=UPI0027DD1C20|nr:protein dachsous-like [Physella acuta]